MPIGNWTIHNVVGAPTARSYAAFMYDAISKKLLLFGGRNVATLLGDTWLLDVDADTWAVQAPAASPSDRAAHAGCTGADGPVIFGGRDVGGLKQDVWSWTAANWSQHVIPGTKPSAREHAAIAASSITDTTFMLWGGDTGGDFDPRMWLFNGTTDVWTSVSPATEPTPRCKHVMFHDPDRETTIMFGGNSLVDGHPLNDMWEWVEGNWYELIGSPRPNGRGVWQGMAYDPWHKRAILAPIGKAAQGSITTIEGDWYNDDETFTIDDGTNPPVVYQFNTLVHPFDVIYVGWDPVTDLQIDLTSLLGTTNQSGTAVKVTCLTTSTSSVVASVYTAGVNYAPVPGLLGQSSPPSSQLTDYLISKNVSSSNVVIDIGRSAYIEEMRQRIAEAINATPSLNITAILNITENDQLVLFNEVPGIAGNMTSSDTVVHEGFIITDMQDAEADSWSYNRSGGLWNEHIGVSETAVLEGASMACDLKHMADVIPNKPTMVLFGGEISGVPANQHYTWAWVEAGLSPIYSLPGTLQGRIEPKFAEASDDTYAMVLGVDEKHLHDFMLEVDNEVIVSQQVNLTGYKLLRFAWRMRYPKRMQQYELLQTAGNATITRVSTLAPGDILSGIRVDTPLFNADHQDQLVKLSGAVEAANNSTARISAVPVDQGNVVSWDGVPGPGQYAAGHTALIENVNLVNEVATGITIEILGMRWVAELLINDGGGEVLCAQLKESIVQADPDGWARANIAAHISKVSAMCTIIFKLRLESYPY